MSHLIANPRPAEIGSYSVPMSWPQSRYPFSRRSESNAPRPAATRPCARPASHSRSQTRAPISNGPYSSQPSSPDVADPLREHRHLTDLDLATRHVGDRVVGDVVDGRGAEHVARLGPEQPEHERAARAVEDPHPLTVAHLRAEPREVVHARPAAGNDHEDVLVVAGHREVAADPPAGREHRGVDDGADRAVDPVRAHPLEEGHRVGALHPELHVRGQVEQSGRLAHREMLAPLDRRPLACRPPRAARPLVGHATDQLTVGFEPLRAFPPGAGDERCAELDMPLVERRRRMFRGFDGCWRGCRMS